MLYKEDFSNSMFIISVTISILWAVFALLIFAIWPLIAIFNIFNSIFYLIMNSPYYTFDFLLIAIGLVIICFLLAGVLYEISKGFIFLERKVNNFENKHKHWTRTFLEKLPSLKLPLVLTKYYHCKRVYRPSCNPRH